ncbi:hypothetical protein AVEN_159919-1 [Araneus ventricosus]|uniref:Uncharacterized protein n=1 Tax=Araneus ventricosus TaxID=182803 RepID=A0A4Y2E2V1_ARAVE|nr:hypothetical protein AVEN_159919-1 [Araneus ventricosus]
MPASYAPLVLGMMPKEEMKRDFVWESYKNGPFRSIPRPRNSSFIQYLTVLPQFGGAAYKRLDANEKSERQKKFGSYPSKPLS